MVCLLALGVGASAINAGGMLIEDAKENNIPGDCRAVAHVLVNLAKNKSKSTPEKLTQLAEKLLTAKGYKGSFGPSDYIAPFYVGMTLQSPPETDQFMAEANESQLADLEEEEEIACVKNALIELSERPATENAASSPAAPQQQVQPEHPGQAPAHIK
jgi:hypothetical protein